MLSLFKRKNILLINIVFFIFISLTSTNLINTSENPLNKNTINTNYITKKEENNFFRYLVTNICASTTYSKSEIKEECSNGPSSYDRILKYNSYQNYISNHDYYNNGLNYITSLFVDSETHHFGNFMNDGVGMIILYIIDGLLLLGWIPLLCCWKKRCFLFGECLYEDYRCIIFWHILTYFLAASIISFLIVVLCFGE